VIEGALALLSGMRRLLVEKSLRAVLWRILTLLLVLMLVVTGGMFWLAEYLAHVWLPSGDAWYWQILAWVVWLLSVILALLAGIVSFTALGSVAAAPWLDELVARTEGLNAKNGDSLLSSAFAGLRSPAIPPSRDMEPNTGKSETVPVFRVPWWKQVMHSLVNSVRPLSGLLIWGSVALALFFIPLIGQIAATVIWGYASIRFLNYELMDPVASRSGWNFKRRKQELGQRRFFYLGFGGMALGLMLVPVVNLLVLPAAAVGLGRSVTVRDA